MKKTLNNRYTLPAIGFGAALFTVALSLFSMSRQQALPAEAQTMSPQEKAAIIASDNFSQLPEEQQRKLIQNTPPHEMMKAVKTLPEAQQKKFRENLMPVMHEQMKQHMQKRMDEFFSLPESQRNDYLDKMIDDMEKHRPPEPQTDKDGNGKDDKDRPHGPPSAKEMKKHIESMTPTERAQHAAFRKAMRQRMKERGIEMKGPPH